MERAGHVKSQWRATENNRRAKYYMLTAGGRKLWPPRPNSGTARRPPSAASSKPEPVVAGRIKMNVFVNLFNGLRSLFQKRRIDSELDEELAAFAEASAADKHRPACRPKPPRAPPASKSEAYLVKNKVWSSRWESVPDHSSRTCACVAAAGAKARIHGHRHRLARPRHRRQHRNLQLLTQFCCAPCPSRVLTNYSFSETSAQRAAPTRFPTETRGCSPLPSFTTFARKTTRFPVSPR